MIKTFDYIKTHAEEVYSDPELLKEYKLENPNVIQKTKELTPVEYSYPDWPKLVDDQNTLMQLAVQAGVIDKIPQKQDIFYLQ